MIGKSVEASSSGSEASRGVPFQQTKRSRLQDRRCSLNEQLKRELRLKAGALNLLKVTSNPKVRHQIELELSYVESNIRLLREKLSKLNTAVDAYQNEKSSGYLPLLPLGLKETKEITFMGAFKDFILEHYSEDPARHEAAIRHFDCTRKKVQRPPRDMSGVNLLKRYLFQLGWAEKRFFSYNKPLKIYFEWYDSLTGDPFVQHSVAFEKGAIIFNTAALLTQISVKEDRSELEGLERAIHSLALAMGWLSHLRDTFSFAPSPDMKPDALDALNSFLSAQAQECVLYKVEMEHRKEEMNLDIAFLLAEEAAAVADWYESSNQRFVGVSAIPLTWVQLSQIKRDHFRAMAHYWTAKGVLSMTDTGSGVRRLFRHHFKERWDVGRMWDPRQPPQNSHEREQLARRHLTLALQYHEDALTRTNLVPELSHMTNILLKASQLSSRQELHLPPDESPELEDPAEIFGRCSEKIQRICPNLRRSGTGDVFRELGPLSLFNAEESLGSRRRVEIRLDGAPGFGFSVSGDAPVCVASVDVGGLAEDHGVQPGDLIVEVGSVDTKWSSHEEVVSLIRESRDYLDIGVMSNPSLALSSEYSHSTISSSSISSPSSLPMKFRPSYFYPNSDTLPRNSDQPENTSPWTFKSLLSPKKRAESHPNLHAQ